MPRYPSLILALFSIALVQLLMLLALFAILETTVDIKYTTDTIEYRQTPTQRGIRSQ